jgi:glycosyltransferase involved in cell wall biosynthesis
MGETVSILLCSADGERFLAQQLESIALQTNSNWRLIASDDSRKILTGRILSSFRQEHAGKVEIRRGPRRGFVANFMSLACDETISSDYFAFCDQDDIWEPEKLARGCRCLRCFPSEVPALYCSSTSLIDERSRPLGSSRINRRPPGFTNALVQNLASGNTMIFNQAARRLLAIAGPRVKVPFHDWWLYLLVTGAGGHVIYDPDPTVRYRQHDNNLWGSHRGLKAKVQRVRLLFHDALKRWSDLNLAALEKMSFVLTEENRDLLAYYASTRKGGLLERLHGLKTAKIYRQTRLESAALLLAAAMNKV